MTPEDDLVYRSPIAMSTGRQVSAQDERDYSTLLRVQKELHAQMESLKSVNVFDLTEKELTVKEQIAAHRLAIDLLYPISNLIDLSVQNITEKHKEG
jgi:hypothetical protein